MQSKIVSCSKCNIERPMLEMSSMSYKGNLKFECADEDNCLSIEKIKKEAELVEKLKEKELRDKYSHLPKEEQIFEMFGVKYDELEELEEKFRDASIHYYDREANKFYSWTFSGKYWYIPKFGLSKYTIHRISH